LISADHTDAAAHNRLGTALQGQARIGEAITEYRTAIELDPRKTLYRGDLAIALLADGALAEGWQLDDARFGDGDALVRQRKIGLKTWEGEPLTGKTLFVWREQGVGDDLRFDSCFKRRDQGSCRIRWKVHY